MPVDAQPPVQTPPMFRTVGASINRAIEQFNSQRPLSGVNANAQTYPGGTSYVTPDAMPRDFFFYGVLVDAGPAGDADFADQRYWVAQVQFGRAATSTTTDKVSAYLDGTGTALWLVASHIAEVILGTHTLPTIDSETSDTTALSTPATFVKCRQSECGAWVFETITFPALLATITAHTGSGPVTWNPYTATSLDGTQTYSIYNGFEPCNGSPGPLGVNVSASDGTVNGGSCVVQPIGVGAIVQITWDAHNSRWAFAQPNSAQ